MTAAATPVLALAPTLERYLTPQEVAEQLQMSIDWVRKRFAKEPVLILDNGRGKGRRRYTTLRIPKTVLDRVVRLLVLAFANSDIPILQQANAEYATLK